MKRSELIADVREILREYSIDSEVADRHIMFLTRTKRAKYLRQREVRELGEYRDQFQQRVVMTLELVDSTTGTLPTGYTLLRTVKKLPNIVGREIFKSLDIRTVNIIGQEIEVLNKARFSSVDYTPIGFIYAYKDDDGYIWLKAPNDSYKFLTEIQVTTILEDPEEIVSLMNMTTHLEDYPITGELWETIRPEILNELLRSKQTPIDVLNNNADDGAKSS